MLSFSGCVFLSKLFDLTRLTFPHLQNKGNNTYIYGYYENWEIIYIKYEHVEAIYVQIVVGIVIFIVRSILV